MQLLLPCAACCTSKRALALFALLYLCTASSLLSQPSTHARGRGAGRRSSWHQHAASTPSTTLHAAAFVRPRFASARACVAREREECMNADGPRDWTPRSHRNRKSVVGKAIEYAHDDITYRFRSGEVLSIPQAERYTSRDWLHHLITMPNSQILKRISGVVRFNIFWSLFVLLVFKFLRFQPAGTKAHSLVGSALGLLLVFRTNSAYTRFWDGRGIWERILSKSRDVARLTTLYADTIGIQRVQKIARLLCAFPIVLQEHLQGVPSSNPLEPFLDEDELKVLDRVSNRPLLVLNKLATEFRNINYCLNWTSRERLASIALTNELSSCIGQCERIVQTPVPLQYSRHTSRFLSIWCLTLPIALVGELGWYVVPFMALVSWGMYGIQEIGLLIEEPFQRALRLEVFANTIRRDVTDMLHVSGISPEPLDIDSPALEYSPPFHQLLRLHPQVEDPAEFSHTHAAVANFNVSVSSSSDTNPIRERYDHETTD